MVNMSRRRHLLLSNLFFCQIYLSFGIHSLLCSARTEHRIFQKLLAMVPNLMEQVVESEAELVIIAESVSLCLVDMTIFDRYLL